MNENVSLTPTLRALAQTKIVLNKEYLQVMNDAQIVGVSETPDSASCMRLMHIQTLLYDRRESLTEKLQALFGAVENYGESVMLLINGKKDRADIYMGIASEQAIQPVFNTFRCSVDSLLPGCQYRVLPNAEIRTLIEDIIPETDGNGIHMASVAAFPSEKQDREEKAQQLDVLLTGMRHRPFSMILLAKAIAPSVISALQENLQQLSTELSPLERATLTLSQSTSDTVGKSISQAVTNSIGYNVSYSQGKSESTGESHNYQFRDVKEEDRQRKLSMAGTVASVVLSMTPVGGAVKGGAAAVQGGSELLKSMFYGSTLTKVFDTADGMLSSKNKPVEKETGRTVSNQHGTSENWQQGQNSSQSIADQEGYNTNHGLTQGETQQVTQTNKVIADLQVQLDHQLKQLQIFSQEGAFQTAAYFIAGDSETAVSAANLYRSICTSKGRTSLRSPICEWNETSQVTNIGNYLRAGRHPVFRVGRNDNAMTVSLAQMIGLRDMTRYFALPDHTVPGIIVSSAAPFAQDVITHRGAAHEAEDRSVHIGHVYHMGKMDAQTPVRLKLDDLTKHLFVSGATGVGKSNFCYQLLDELDKKGAHMLIIEPAKGEYRHVLGGREDFHVYGVDPMTGPVLRINPFAYPDEIPTVQHIERLLDIFNAAWPMYSAMPAILKEAVEKIYIDKGFNMLGRGRPEGAQFPCFHDLLEALPNVINASSYSAEVKGNYIGALVTRVKSLTNGLYGLIFSENEIGDETLFDSNVIVDISRIGSAETKALLMGVLTMRLMEHRMAEGLINSPLRHVTVLEEAHHLLRRHNPSGGEGNNARAASVEMLASAIAEMRTTGEGFIIADQSPSVMDWSVIRNTQTKVFFMLPDREDRTIAGNALSLDEAQQQEIAKLKPGVAVVYQNGWTDAVLCKIEYFEKSRERPFMYVAPNCNINPRMLKGQAIALLMKRRVDQEKSSVDEKKINTCLEYDETLMSSEEKQAWQVLKEWKCEGKISSDAEAEYGMLCNLLPLEEIVQGASQVRDMKEWAKTVEEGITYRAELSKEEMRKLISFGLNRWGMRQPAAKKLYVQYIEHCLNQE